jgi:hypothetical protein
VIEPEHRPAYYSAARPGGLRDWWTILHPPYTAWHLSYVAIGACLAPHVDGARLLATLAAFFAAVGVAAHALDELHGRPLRTEISSRALVVAAVLGLTLAVTIGVVGVVRVGWVLLPFVVVGPVLALAYNLEWFGGFVHTDLGFALSWGAFPVITAYVAQTDTVRAAAIIAAVGATGLSLAQRALSTPARRLRRQVESVDGSLTHADGTVTPITHASLLAPLEVTLRALSWSVVALAVAMAVARLT